MLGTEKSNSNQESRSVSLRGLLVSMVTGTWPKIVIIVFIVELVVLFLGSTIPLPASTVNQISSQNGNLAQTSGSLDLIARALFLFSNNFRIALFEFVPFLGWFFFGYSMYNTALAIEVIGINASLPGPLVTLSLFFEPHSWLELPAYAIATTQSFYLISTIWRRSMFTFEVARTGLVVGIVAAELFIAAVFESSEISLASNLIADFALPWLAFFVLLVLLVLGRKQLLKGYRSSVIFQQTSMPAMPQNFQQVSPYMPQAYQARFCGKCGAKVHNPQGAIFCDQCGQRIMQPIVGGGNNPTSQGATGPPPPSPSNP
jgi:Stage II sporulation protein M